MLTLSGSLRVFRALEPCDMRTGERSAVIYTLVESAKRHGLEPYAYLKGVLERLPSPRTSELDALLPSNWQPSAQATLPVQIAG
jgi:hypothetical protein